MITPLKSRRLFLYAAVGGTATLLVPATRLAGQQQAPQPPPAPRQRPPRIELPMVEEFVRVAHGNLERTRELLAQEPALLNATWDWGGGDWETGLGGASHMGNREIALLLIGAGARMDIFAAAMLGRTDIVKSMLDAFPGLLQSKGPHGIPLMAHAKKGGEDAAGVVALLESLGVTA